MLHVSGVFETFILSNVHKLFQVLAEQTLEPGPTLPAVVSSLSPPNISSLLDISLPESKLRFYEKLRSRGGIWLQRQLFEYPISGLPSDGGGPSPMLADGDTLPSFTEASSSSLSGEFEILFTLFLSIVLNTHRQWHQCCQMVRFQNFYLAPHLFLMSLQRPQSVPTNAPTNF